MKLSDLRQFVANLPEEFNEFELTNGEYGFLDKEGEEAGIYYRRDLAISVTTVDEITKEIIFLHQAQEEIDIIKDGSSKDVK